MDGGVDSTFRAVTNRAAPHICGQASLRSAQVSLVMTRRRRPLGHRPHASSTLLRKDKSHSQGLHRLPGRPAYLTLLAAPQACQHLTLPDFILHVDSQLSQDYSLKNISSLHRPAMPALSYIEFLHVARLLPLSLFCPLGLFVPPFANTAAA